MDKDRPGVYFQWKECTARFIGICTKRETKQKFYDFTDQKVRDELRAAEMVLQVWEKP